MKYFFILLVLLLSSGCEQVLYDSLHGNQKIHCHSIPNADERRACEERHSKPYSTYKSSQEYR